MDSPYHRLAMILTRVFIQNGRETEILNLIDDLTFNHAKYTLEQVLDLYFSKSNPSELMLQDLTDRAVSNRDLGLITRLWSQ